MNTRVGVKTVSTFGIPLFIRVLLFFCLALISESQVVPAGGKLRGGIRRDRVTYTTFRPGNWDIYLFHKAGQTPERLTTDPGLDYDPVMSRDGRWVVFCSERSGNPRLYVLDVQHRGEPRLLIDNDRDSMEDQAALSPDGKWIAFVSTASGNADIYLLPFRPDKTTPIKSAKNLTHHPAGDFRPSFSPDGRKLAFSSDRDLPVNVLNPITRLRSGDIYVLDLANEQLKRLTDAPGWDGSPAWSDDGKSIVFYSQRGLNPTFREPQARIWIMNTDGSNQRVLTPNESLAISPECLPDGRVLYSRTTKEGSWQIVSVDGNGADERIESDASKNRYWKPARGATTGEFLAHGEGPVDPGVPVGRETRKAQAGPILVEGAPFRRRLPDREIDLYPLRLFTALLSPTRDILLQTNPAGGTDVLVSTIDGRNQQKLFQYESTQSSFAGLSWSKDGEWIAYTRGGWRTPDSQASIWKMRSDGSEDQNLSRDTPSHDSYPSFSGDGKLIVFRSGRNGHFDLYVMNSDGTNIRQLTADPANEIFPVFSPNNKQIAFVSDRGQEDAGLFNVYLMDLHEDLTPAKIRQVTNNHVQNGHLAYSYDGKWLLFSSEQGGINDEEPLVEAVVFSPESYGEMYAYRIADATLIRLTHNKWEEGVSSWEAPLK
jgi:Tol biopolymer transport system component